MNKHLPTHDYYTAQQAAKKLGVSEARIRKLANTYGWECHTVASTKMFSAADIFKYIENRQYFRRMLGS